MSPDARSYLSNALDIMEKNSLMRHQVTWADVRRTAFSQAQGAREPANTYDAINAALQTVGAGHSSFMPPKQVEEVLNSSPDTAIDGPEGRTTGERIGYVSLPGVLASDAAYAQYVRQGRDAVARADSPAACGWVVDLRDNRGGNMWPMLAVVAPLLGSGTVGMFVDTDGKKSLWTVEDGSPREDGRPFGWGDSAPVTNAGAPVAVLTSGETASSGEAVVIAFQGRPDTPFFGQYTGGIPTGNAVHRLSDGAMLVLTEVRDADRTGRTYDASIPPDEVIDADGRSSEARPDKALAAAKDWLLRHEACH
ncbi:S41 family peptidase [Streptomyces sp. NBC_00539]|uniref:S41 family peptidase n=1 Tax=Streptomyces sp. NBC_00539 TaxID=2975770 RepID=UPI002E80C3E8|nr:S41 family peptidase [Streptomyces sp. NBC_00539]WUC63020.1 S41 family peptidase [Streptomyces sp. NBC_00539]